MTDSHVAIAQVTMPGVEEVMLDNLDHCISIMEVASKSRVVANQKMVSCILTSGRIQSLLKGDSQCLSQLKSAPSKPSGRPTKGILTSI